MRRTALAITRTDIDYELLWTSVGVVAAALAWALASYPLPSPIGRCVFKALTGWPCVTCGGTRALRALFAGHLAIAVRLNPLVVAGAAGWTAYGIYAIGALTHLWPRLRIQLDHRAVVATRWGVLAVVALTWAYLAVDAR